MKKNIFKIVIILIILVAGVLLQDKAQDYATLIKISKASREITKNAENVQVRVTEKYNDGSEIISETYIKDDVYVTRRIDGKYTSSNSLEWATKNKELLCNMYKEYEYEYDGKVIKELACIYNHENGSETQAMTRMAVGNLLLMYDSKNMNTNIFNMPKIEYSEYNGKPCITLKSEYRTWYIEKESLRTVAIENKVFEDDSPCFYSFEYDIEAPEGIFEAPNVSNKHYDSVSFMEFLPTNNNRHNNINMENKKAITGTNLKPGEELIETVELKDGEELNFLKITKNEFGLQGFEIESLETYNKFREKYSGLRELTKEDFEEYYVGIVYKEGYKLNHLQNLLSTRNNTTNYIFDTEKAEKASLVLIVSPILEDSTKPRFIENEEKFNITEEIAINTITEKIDELNPNLVLDDEGYVNVETSTIVTLDNEGFASLDVIKTPVRGEEPICWKLTVVDSNHKRLDAYVNIMTGELIGSVNEKV